jgi:threonine dehydrogenase-like Zn-dependent dehydrogenase
VRFALLKGASRVIVIDSVPERLQFAREKSGAETINFREHTDVVKRIQEMVPGGLDVAINCGTHHISLSPSRYHLLISLICVLYITGTFHEPKTLLHKAEKRLMLETDDSEIVNEMITATKKMGSCGLIADYIGYTNHFNIGALMEKGIRLIGHGQSPVHKYWHELLQLIEEGKFDPTL